MCMSGVDALKAVSGRVDQARAETDVSRRSQVEPDSRGKRKSSRKAPAEQCGQFRVGLASQARRGCSATER